MKDVTLVVLSHYNDLFERFRDSVETHEPGLAKILVRDGLDIPAPPDWLTIQGKEPFNYAHNMNLGWVASWPTDVIIAGDDVRFAGEFVNKFQEIAYSDPKIGIVTVQFYGLSPFVAGYFKREMIDAVGYMDERFTGYGHEDVDFCRRMEDLGWVTFPTTEVRAMHAGGGTSFYRREREPGQVCMGELAERNLRLYNEKWGIKE